MCPGPSAIEYFESHFPSVQPFTIKGMYHNKAEWIVDLTTKVRSDCLTIMCPARQEMCLLLQQ